MTDPKDIDSDSDDEDCLGLSTSNYDDSDSSDCLYSETKCVTLMTMTPTTAFSSGINGNFPDSDDEKEGNFNLTLMPVSL